MASGGADKTAAQESASPTTAAPVVATQTGGGMATLCCHRVFALRAAVQLYLWSTVSLSYYSISYNASNLSPDIYLNFGLVSLPLFLSGPASARLMDVPAFGRRGASAVFLAAVVLALGTGVLVPSLAVYASMVGTFAAEAIFALLYMQV